MLVVCVEAERRELLERNPDLWVRKCDNGEFVVDIRCDGEWDVAKDPINDMQVEGCDIGSELEV